MELLERSATLQREYATASQRNGNPAAGQVFTPSEVASFMAGLFDELPETFRLLDPGAGVGTLSVAVCERALRLKSPRSIEVELFETDSNLSPLIQENMESCKRALHAAGHSLKYVIRTDDFIEAAASLVESSRDMFSSASVSQDFDAVIMNPPYFKVRKNSPHARIMERIVHGQPNAYAFFLALGARLLRQGGELVAITPRSFCNGLYFRGFRRWFFPRMALDHIHLFESRTDTFKESGVLQESVITKSHKLGKPSTHVQVTASWGKDIDASDEGIAIDPSQTLCGGSDMILRIPTSHSDLRTMSLLESLGQSFTDTGLRISTGPVVLFRATEHTQRNPGESTCPLLLPHNVLPFSSRWPHAKKDKPQAVVDCDESRSILVPNRNYVLLKRFSAKEEKRRLTAGCLFAKQYGFERIGLENHLNYIYHESRELQERECLGIAALLNSTMLDKYFRILSGNTQVNATEIRTLPFPDLQMVGHIGEQLAGEEVFDPSRIDEVVEGTINRDSVSIQ